MAAPGSTPMASYRPNTILKIATDTLKFGYSFCTTLDLLRVTTPPLFCRERLFQGKITRTFPPNCDLIERMTKS